MRFHTGWTHNSPWIPRTLNGGFQRYNGRLSNYVSRRVLGRKLRMMPSSCRPSPSSPPSGARFGIFAVISAGKVTASREMPSKRLKIVLAFLGVFTLSVDAFAADIGCEQPAYDASVKGNGCNPYAGTDPGRYTP
jgi:hypothetical protein